MLILFQKKLKYIYYDLRMSISVKSDDFMTKIQIIALLGTTFAMCLLFYNLTINIKTGQLCFTVTDLAQ